MVKAAKVTPAANGHSLTIPGLIEAFDDAERPLGARNKYPTDALIVELLKTAETGRAKRVRVADQAGLLRRLHMHFRHAIRNKEYAFRFKTLDPQTMLMWAEKIKETSK